MLKYKIIFAKQLLLVFSVFQFLSGCLDAQKPAKKPSVNKDTVKNSTVNYPPKKIVNQYRNAGIIETADTKLVQKLVKQRKDSLEIYQTQNRPDLAEKESQEISVIEKYLPAQLSADELKSAIEKIIAETGAASPADMGKVMGAATKVLAGKTDGKAISAMVKELLAAK